MNIRILPEAERDLEIGADFYELQRPGLGRYFNDAISADIESLQIYAGVHERVRELFRCLSMRFPFAIFYDLKGTQIDNYAVLDCRQNPQQIAMRLTASRTDRLAHWRDTTFSGAATMIKHNCFQPYRIAAHTWIHVTHRNRSRDSASRTNAAD